ncbi:hypothetical protein BDZ91DRAFT_811469 [Kalaharituber pfeilii]|nr:hypothetical protein BDZ91DRAFT_811469 [Kalaharituber pfeilii]
MPGTSAANAVERLICPSCSSSRTFKTRRALDEHTRAKHRGLRCPNCPQSKMFRSAEALAEHSRAVHAFPCPWCGKVYRSVYERQQHQMKEKHCHCMHRGQTTGVAVSTGLQVDTVPSVHTWSCRPEPLPSEDASRTYICSFPNPPQDPQLCGRQFKTRMDLNQHQRQKKHGCCQYCSQCFDDPQGYQFHLMMVNHEVPEGGLPKQAALTSRELMRRGLPADVPRAPRGGRLISAHGTPVAPAMVVSQSMANQDAQAEYQSMGTGSPVPSVDRPRQASTSSVATSSRTSTVSDVDVDETPASRKVPRELPDAAASLPLTTETEPARSPAPPSSATTPSTCADKMHNRVEAFVATEITGTLLGEVGTQGSIDDSSAGDDGLNGTRMNGSKWPWGNDESLI